MTDIDYATIIYLAALILAGIFLWGLVEWFQRKCDRIVKNSVAKILESYHREKSALENHERFIELKKDAEQCAKKEVKRRMKNSTNYRRKIEDSLGKNK
jgi:hypothetical protein